MFGLFDAKCPIEEESRAWVERRMAWAIGAFGFSRLRKCTVIQPTPEFFPDPYDGTPQAGEKLFDRVRKYAGIEASRVHLNWVAAKHDNRGGPLFIQSEGDGAAGTYHQGESVHQITIELQNLRDPIKLAAVCAHELCHVHLLADKRVSPTEEDHEPLTDLLTIFLGLGIFGANAAVSYQGWSDSQKYGWQVSSLGYLQKRTWGYALGVFAKLRGETNPSWKKHLDADVRAAMSAADRYLAKYGFDEAELKRQI